ncbi:MAG TPA: ABC transporter permease [Terracidiphilus sp.]|nr:ABC transporter permease [Terracidiphilus sp.]
MSFWRELTHGLRGLVRKGARDREFDAELQNYFDEVATSYRERGLSEEEARQAARRECGNLHAAKEQVRSHGWENTLRSVVGDLRFAARQLHANPGFTAISIVTLGLGIGANIAVFSVVNTILLRPLPFRDSQQLVRIVEKDSKAGESGRTYTADATQDFQQQNRSFQSVSGYFAFTGPNNFKLSGNGQPLPATGMLVAQGFFETLGVEPSVGRLFQPQEFLHHAHPAALLSYPYWKRQFGGDPNIIGRTVDLSDKVDLNNRSMTVVGVLPETFDFGAVFSPGAKVDLFVPYIMDDYRDDGNDLALVGRLKPGVSIARAQNEADTLFPGFYFEHKHPEYGKGYTAQLTGLKEYVSGKLRRSLIVLWWAVGLILLIVCVNLSNLLLARAAARNKEFAMRTALGARLGRIMRQLLTESFVLAIAGALVGLGLAWAILAYLAHQGSLALPLLSMVRVDGAALAWTLLIAVGAALLFGAAPALRMSARDLQEALKDSGHGTSAGRKHDRIRSVLVISEIALACVLLVGAGLLLRSFLRVLDVDLGFEPSHSAAVSVDYDDGGNAVKRAVIWHEVVDRTLTIPGIEAAGISDNLPMSRNRSWGIAVRGEQKKNALDFTPIFVYIVSPGYLKAMGMRLVEGRDISWDDMANNRNVVVLNETVAQKLWPKQNPIGRMAVAGGADVEVIGVIADVHESSAEESAQPQMYLPSKFGPEGSYLVVRSKIPPGALATSVMRMLREINPGQSASEFRPIQELVDHATSPRRFFVLLVGAFAALGLLLASLGIYGVISYSVTRQNQEIGIRMALGATEGRVQLDVIAKTLRLALIGIAIGFAVSFAIARLIASLLFHTAPTDPVTFAGMVVLLGGVALLAGYVPARRASRVDPMVALRTN